MAFFSKIGHSADLVGGMAQRLGADGFEMFDTDPDRAAQAFRSVVLRCTTCSDQKGCAKLQAENDRLDAAPDYCRNKAELDAAARR